MALAPTQRNSLSGATLGAASFALMTSVDTIFKLLSAHHPAHQILFINACFAFLPIFAWAKMSGGISQLRTTQPGGHVLRAMASVLSAFAAIYAYSRLPLTDFYAIVFAGPLVVTALSSLLLKEKVERARWLAILVGFAGILVIIDPASSQTYPDMEAGRIAAFISVFCYALSVVMIRRMRYGESSLTFTFYGYMTSFVVGGALVLLYGGTPLTGHDLAGLALSGTQAGIATICLISAYQRTPVSLVAPFQYTQIIWGALAGYIIWAHIPEARLFMGAIIVAACGLFVIYQEIRAKDPL